MPQKRSKMTESTWSYRIMRHAEPNGDVWYGMHEVYDMGDGEQLWTDDPVRPFGETVDELREDMELMLRDMKRPIMDYSSQSTEE